MICCYKKNSILEKYKKFQRMKQNALISRVKRFKKKNKRKNKFFRAKVKISPSQKASDGYSGMFFDV